MILQSRMGETFFMLRHKCLFFILFLCIESFAIQAVQTNSKINYKEMIPTSKLTRVEVDKVKKYCLPLIKNDFKNKKYVAKRYLKKGTIICSKDVEEYTKNSILFDFGPIEIEKPGKIIFESDKYIKIKKIDGKIEKIYKDGRVR